MASKLINDLTHVPDIIAGLGLGVAEAQRRFDLDYLQGLERSAVVAQSLLGDFRQAPAQPPPAGGAAPPPASAKLSDSEKTERDNNKDAILALLSAIAPTRYQFTETTISVKLDLAQHLDVSGQLGLAIGVGAVAVNAALTVGYNYDYRAAAECTATIHATPVGANVFEKLLDRAAALKHGDDLTLPPSSPADQGIRDQTAKIFERMAGFLPAPIAVKDDKKP